MPTKHVGYLGILFLLLTVVYKHTAFARAPVPSPLGAADRAALIWVTWDVNASEKELQVYIDRCKSLNARHLVIPVFGCQTDARSSDVGSCPVPREPFAYKQADLAMKSGLVASFLPIVLSSDGKWRGDFVPDRPEEWFQNYERWILGIAQKAESMRMPEFVVATEMGNLYKLESKWRALIQEVRLEFSNPLVVTVNWDNLYIKFWDEVDAIGVSAYHPLAYQVGDSDEILKARAKKHRDELIKLSQKEQRPLHITEVGFPSISTGAVAPWAYDSSLKLTQDWDLQARAFSAFFQAWKNTSELMHLGVWAIGDPKEPRAELLFDITGKPASAVVSEYFASLASIELVKYRRPPNRASFGSQ